ncbi:hypothetical protein DFH09DRAFT_1155178 [Mycena vulgaris]|nr:hypothetical protein DFH09DRAFT_1155178 [Mycena vulgaris]
MACPMPIGMIRIVTTNMDPDQAIRVCKNGLMDPFHPPTCALPLLIPAQSFFDGKNGKTATDIVWPTVIRFLTAKRTPEQFTHMKLQLNTCRCPESTNANCQIQHDLGRQIYRERWEQVLGGSVPQVMTPFHCLINTLFAGLFDYLQTIGVTRTAKGVTDMWPKTPADLLPHGAAVTIQSLEQWLEHLRDPAPSALALLSQLVRICRTLIVPSMVASSKLPALVVTTIRETCEVAQHRMDEPWFSPQTIDSVACAFNQRISYVELFLVLFSSRRSNGALTGAELFRFGGDSDKDFFHCANTVLQIYTRSRLFPPDGEKDPKMGGPRESCIHILQEVTASMILHLNSRYGISRDALDPGARIMSDSWEQRSADPREAIRSRLLSMKNEERCAKIGCTESLQTSSKLQRCSHCKVLCWCSKEHQKLAWTDSQCAHRDVCKLMAKVVEAAGGDLNDYATFERREARIPLTDVLRMAAWIDRFRALRDNGPDVFKILSSHLQRNVCSAAGCPKATAPPKLKLNKCSGCGVFQYCDAECQLKGWKDPTAAHKEVCKAIKRVVEAGGGDLTDLETLSRRTAEGHVPHADVEIVVPWFKRFNERFESKEF